MNCQALLFLCDGAEEFLAGRGEPVYSLLQQADGGAQLLLVLKQHGHVHVDVPHRAVVPLELSHGLLKHNNNNNTFCNELVNIIGEKNAKYQIIIIIMIITSISSKSLSSTSFLGQYRYEWIMYEQKKTDSNAVSYLLSLQLVKTAMEIFQYYHLISTYL